MPYSTKPKDFFDGIATASVKEVGMNAHVVNENLEQISNGTYPNRHSLLLYKDQKLVLEKYFAGEDEIWGHRIGHVKHGKHMLHDVRSISKSVVSACMGIALEKGFVQSIHQNIFDFLPEYIQFKSEGRENLTIEHLLTMTVGLEWSEEIPYSNPVNSQIEMDFNADPLAYFLSRPLRAKPGTEWCYNGGTTEALAAIIKRTSGLNIHDFAKEFLFKPLGILHSEWTRLWNYEPSAAAGLRLTSRDILKFGMLYMNDGVWKNVQVVPKQWVAESLTAKVKRQGMWSNGDYGYQFWLFYVPIHGEETAMAAALGSGGQCIYMDKSNNFMLVSTAGNYPPASPDMRAFDLMLNLYDSFMKKPKRAQVIGK
jgi:CubicO group peptidase (beta-lactamase class C family)